MMKQSTLSAVVSPPLAASRRQALSGWLAALALIFLSLGTVQAQTRQISGRVTEDNGSPLPGVSILIKGTTNGTATDLDGRYTLTVPENNAVLVFSFIGYTTREAAVGAQTTLNVSMTPDAKALEEVVVVGYGTQREEAVTGSVASIGGDVMREVPSANISQALQGRLLYPWAFRHQALQLWPRYLRNRVLCNPTA
jgi:hypothetical protein